MAKDLKNKIKTAYENETPNFRERIISACENETQIPAPAPTPSSSVKAPKKFTFFRRLVATTACLILFGAGLFVGRIIPQSQPVATAETCVYIDVNPSLELSLDKENTVLACTAANEDAEIILGDLELEGVPLKTALHAIVGTMYVNGYLSSEDNSMLISVDKNNDGANSFLAYITDQINEVFQNSEMECAIIAQNVKANEDLKRRAEEQGISVGKMHLLDKIIDGMDGLTQSDISGLSGMSIKDLNLIYSQNPSDTEKPTDELISGTVKLNVTAEAALNAALSVNAKTIDDVKEYRVLLFPSKHGKLTVVYAVTLKFYNDDTVYTYEVNCQTGEVTVNENESPSDEHPDDDKQNPHEPFEPQK